MNLSDILAAIGGTVSRALTRTLSTARTHVVVSVLALLVFGGSAGWWWYNGFTLSLSRSSAAVDCGVRGDPECLPGGGGSDWPISGTPPPAADVPGTCTPVGPSLPVPGWQNENWNTAPASGSKPWCTPYPPNGAVNGGATFPDCFRWDLSNSTGEHNWADMNATDNPLNAVTRALPQTVLKADGNVFNNCPWTVHMITMAEGSLKAYDGHNKDAADQDVSRAFTVAPESRDFPSCWNTADDPKPVCPSTFKDEFNLTTYKCGFLWAQGAWRHYISGGGGGAGSGNIDHGGWYSLFTYARDCTAEDIAAGNAPGTTPGVTPSGGVCPVPTGTALPATLSASCGATQNILTWQNPRTLNAAVNSIVRSVDGGNGQFIFGEGGCWNTFGISTFTDRNVQAGHRYTYRVKTSTTVVSNEVSCPPGSPTPTPSPTSSPGAPTVDIKANGSDGPLTITSGTAATISWTSSNATSCVVTPGDHTGLSGSFSSGNLSSNQTYAIACVNGSGSVIDSVQVNIAGLPTPTPGVPPAVDIKANGSNGPITISSGTSATISWTSSNATSCSVTPGAHGGLTGSFLGDALFAPQMYAAVCVGSGGQTGSDSVQVLIAGLTPTPTPSTTSTPGTTPTPTYTITPAPGDQLQCQPAVQSVVIGQEAVIAAFGGTGIYSFAASEGGSLRQLDDHEVVASYPTVGYKTVVLTDGQATVQCHVSVANNVTPTPPSSSWYVSPSASIGPDPDGDGIPDPVECSGVPSDQCPDTDGDGTPNNHDTDSDGDGYSDAFECPNFAQRGYCVDTDGDGIPDFLDADSHPTGNVGGVQTGPGDTALLALLVSTVVALLYVSYAHSPLGRRHEVGEIARKRDPLDFRE